MKLLKGFDCMKSEESNSSLRALANLYMNSLDLLLLFSILLNAATSERDYNVR